jgi:hypothetical protein
LDRHETRIVSIRAKRELKSGGDENRQRKGDAIVFVAQDLFGVIGATTARAGTAGAARELGQAANAFGRSLANSAFGNSVADADVHENTSIKVLFDCKCE